MRYLGRAARIVVGAAVAAVVVVAVAIPAAEASSPHSDTRTSDSCTRVQYHNHTYVNATNGRAYTAIQSQFGGQYDPDCTGYVEVRTSSASGTWTTTSSSYYVQRNYGNAGFNYTDHNARSSNGVLWGSRMY